MVAESLTPTPLSHNSITQLAELLEANFQYHRQQQTLFYHEFIPTLKIVVGLGFTAVLVDNLYVSTHRADLNRFLDYFNTKTEQDSIAPIALAAAKIIDTGAHVFRQQEACPTYYNAFAKAFKIIIKSGLLDTPEKEKVSQHFIQKMLRSSLF